MGGIFLCVRVCPGRGFTLYLPFGLQTDIDFPYFGLNSVLVFEGIRGCLEVFVVSTLNE